MRFYSLKKKEQNWEELLIELLGPVQEQSVKQSFCSVGLWSLCGPTLINAEQEDINRLCDLHLHINLDTFKTIF